MVTYTRDVARWSGVIAFLLLGNSVFAAGSKQWLFDLSYSVAGIALTVPVHTKEQCSADAVPIPDISRPGYQCTSRRQQWFDNKTLVWQLDCSNDWESIQGTGRVNFDGDKAAGDIHLQIINPVSPPEYMAVAFQGRPLGECKKLSPARVSKPLTGSIGVGLAKAGNKADLGDDEPE